MCKRANFHRIVVCTEQTNQNKMYKVLHCGQEVKNHSNHRVSTREVFPHSEISSCLEFTSSENLLTSEISFSVLGLR